MTLAVPQAAAAWHNDARRKTYRLNTGEYQTSIQETIGTIDITATGETIADVIQIDNNLEYSDFEEEK